MRVRYAIPLFAVAALLVAACLALKPTTAAEGRVAAAPGITKWEYKVVTDDAGSSVFEDKLNSLGTQGWECVSAITNVRGGGQNDNYTQAQLILKRPKQ